MLTWLEYSVSISDKRMLESVSYNTEIYDIVAAKKKTCQFYILGIYRNQTLWEIHRIAYTSKIIICIHKFFTNLWTVSKMTFTGKRMIFNQNVVLFYNQQN